MIITYAFLFGIVGYLFYKSKDEVIVVNNETINSSNEIEEDETLHKDLNNLFLWLFNNLTITSFLNDIGLNIE